MQHELLRVLYPVFIHCFMDLVAKGHIQEGATKWVHKWSFIFFSFNTNMTIVDITSSDIFQ